MCANSPIYFMKRIIRNINWRIDTNCIINRMGEMLRKRINDVGTGTESRMIRVSIKSGMQSVNRTSLSLNAVSSRLNQI